MTAAATLATSWLPQATPTAYEWVTIDIETMAGRPEEAERWMRLHWAPSPKLKAETIGNKYLEALETKKGQLALIEGARIICVSLRSNTELRCLHCLDKHRPTSVNGGLVEGFATMADMLIAVRNLLDAMVGPDTTIVGHNLRHFDLPMLRHAYVREGIRPPVMLTARDVDVFDTMLEYGYRFSRNEKLFISLSDLMESFGLTSHKGAVDGSQVGELVASGQFDTIIKYAMLDVLATADVFLRMTGQAEGLK